MGSIWQARGAQERPRNAQRAPPKRPRASKSRPRAARADLKPLQNDVCASKMKFWHVRREKIHSKGSRSYFSSFFGRCATSSMRIKHGKNLAKIVELWFSHIRRFFALQAYVHENTSKNAAPGAPKPSPERPKLLQNRARSNLRRTKTSQDRQQRQQEAQNTPRKRPRAKNSASMAQQGPNKVWIWRVGGTAGPPLR